MSNSGFVGTVIAACLTALFIGGGGAFAQLQTGNLYGRVMDRNGAALPGVTLTLCRRDACPPATGQAAATQTSDANGQFRFLALDPTTYGVDAERSGFSSIVYPNIVINIGRNTEIAITLTPTEEPSASPSVTSNGGADLYSFATAHGQILVYLPDDRAAGDTISGIVYPEPQGQSDVERRANADTLGGYIVDVGGAESRVSDHFFHIALPAAAAGAVPLLLKDGRRNLGAASAQIAPIAPAVPQPSIAPFAEAGRPMQMLGPFDGDLTNTQAVIGGRPAPVLAESPRQAVLMSPNAPTGPVSVQVRDGAHNLSAVYNNISVSLSTPRTTLARGESGQITLQVQGLQGLHATVPVELRASPTIILQGGNQQVILIDPNAVHPDGQFARQIQFRVVAVGPFDVTARLNPSAHR